MSSRDEILAKVRRSQPAPTALPTVPTFDVAGVRLLDKFKEGVERMGGRAVEATAEENLDALVRQLYPAAKVICSATPEVVGTRAVDSARKPQALEDVDVGIVRAVYGVAETGSVWLTDAQFKVNALGFLAQHLVVLLDPNRIVGNLHDAYRERAQFDAPYGVFMTGPSATADIEGVLIHGAQGIRTLTVLLATARTVTS